MVKNKGLTRSVSNPVPRSSIGSRSRLWLPGRRAWKGRRKTPAPHGHPSPAHLSERDLTGAVRATAAITAAITRRSLARSSAEGRPGHSRSSRSSHQADASLPAPSPAPAQSVRCQTCRGLRLLSRDRHHFRVPLPPFLSEPPQPPALGSAAARR